MPALMMMAVMVEEVQCQLQAISQGKGTSSDLADGQT